MKVYKRVLKINGKDITLEGNMPIPEKTRKKNAIDWTVIAQKMQEGESILIKSAATLQKLRNALKALGSDYVTRVEASIGGYGKHRPPKMQRRKHIPLTMADMARM